MSISFTAHDAKLMELHKNDIMFGVRERVYAEIMAAAYKGNQGIVIEIPEEYIPYGEYQLFIRELIKSGFIVGEEQYTDGGMCTLDVYWGSL